jgi:hypothetical protein
MAVKYRGDLKDRLKKAEMDEKSLFWLDTQEDDTLAIALYEAELLEKQKELVENISKADFYSKRWNYNAVLADMGLRMISSLGLPKGFFFVCNQTRSGVPINVFGKSFSGNDTKDGILIALKYGTQVFHGAFWTVGIAEIDVGALRHLILRLENTADHLVGALASGS